jgi:hypothetical protein
VGEEKPDNLREEQGRPIARKFASRSFLKFACLGYSLTLNMETLSYSETSVNFTTPHDDASKNVVLFIATTTTLALDRAATVIEQNKTFPDKC